MLNPFILILRAMISVPVFLLIFLPLHLLRLIAMIIPKKKKIHRFLKVRDSFWAAQCYAEIATGVILVEGVQEGVNPLECFKVLFKKKVEEHKELKCCIDEVLGYPCFLEEENFSLDEHIFLEDGQSCESLAEFREKLLTTPFQRGKSPWTFHVKSKGKDPVTHFFLRIHHALGDGYSILNLLHEESEIQRPYFPVKGWKKLLVKVHSLLTLFPPIPAFSIWSKKFDPKKGFFVVPASEPLNLELMKGIRKKYGVKFLAIPLTGLTAAFRRHLLKKGMELPDYLAGTVPVPGPEKVGSEMRNAMSMIVPSLPLKFGDLESLLFQVNGLVKEHGKESFKGYYKMGLSLGVLPQFVLKAMGPPPVSFVASDFPGPEERVMFAGKECQELRFFGNFSAPKIALFLGSLSYNGKWQPTLTVSKDFCGSEEEAQDFVDSVVEFVEMLVN